MSFALKKVLLEKSLLKESIANLVIQVHNEQWILELQYILQQDHSDSKLNDSQNIEL